MTRRRVAPALRDVVEDYAQTPGMTTAIERDIAQARRELRALLSVANGLQPAADVLAAVAHQLRGMGQCAHCADFDVNGQARELENLHEMLARAIARLDKASGGGT